MGEERKNDSTRREKRNFRTVPEGEGAESVMVVNIYDRVLC